MVAIMLQNEGKELKLSPHFGKCKFIGILNDSNEVSIMKNQWKKGRVIAGMLIKGGVKAVIAHEMGEKPLNILKEAGVKVYGGKAGEDLEKLLDAYEAGRLSEEIEQGSCRESEKKDHECCGGHGEDHECCGGHGEGEDHECCGGHGHEHKEGECEERGHGKGERCCERRRKEGVPRGYGVLKA